MIKKNLQRKISKLLATVMVVSTLVIGNWGGLNPNAAGTPVDAVNIAATQVGYHEKASNANLDDNTANSGSGNYTKYARDLGVANGNPWCAYFTWWCMQSAGVDSNSYPRSGYVPTIYNWFQSRGLYRARGTYTPHKGDYIIFGSQSHVGLVESVSGDTVNTIEGNSSDQVIRRQYSLSNTYILGYGLMNSAGDYNAPVVSNVKISNQTSKGYTVTCTVSDESGISFVSFPTWTAANGQDDLDKSWLSSSGYSMGQVSGNTATFYVDLSKHNNETGQYITHIYAQDVYGNLSSAVGVTVIVDTKAPVISDVQVSNIDSNGYDVTFKISDDASGIQFVACPTYTAANGISELPSNWNTMNKYYATVSNGVGTYHVNTSDHNNATGEYWTEIRAYDNYCNYAGYVIKGINVPSPNDNSTESTDQGENVTDGTQDDVTDGTQDDVTDGTQDDATDGTPSDATDTGTDDTNTSDITVTPDDDDSSKDDIPTGDVETDVTTVSSEDMLDDISAFQIDVSDNTVENTIQDSEITITDSTVSVDNSTNVTYDNSQNEVTDNSVTNDNSVTANVSNNYSTVNNVTNEGSTTNVYNSYSGQTSGTSYSKTYAQLSELKDVYQNYLDTYPDQADSEQLYDALNDMVEELVNIYLSEYVPDDFEVDDTTGDDSAGIEEMDDTETNNLSNSSLMEYYTIVNGDLIKVSISFQ